MNIDGFSPIIDHNSKIIILGSIPSIESLKNNEYYGNPRNQFWKLIYSLFNREVAQSYEDKLHFLLNHRIALWDVISRCYREGSLDSNIKNPEINDFKTLFLQYPKLKYIFFNGSKAEKLFIKNIDKMIIKEKRLFRLPSSSPARTISFDEKLEQWKIVKTCLN